MSEISVCPGHKATAAAPVAVTHLWTTSQEKETYSTTNVYSVHTLYKQYSGNDNTGVSLLTQFLPM